MAEPPAKKSRYHDDRDSYHRDPRPSYNGRGDRGARESGRARHDRDRKHRSLSPEHHDRRHERSRSRDRMRPSRKHRDRSRDRGGEKYPGKEGGRDRDEGARSRRSPSADRYQERRGPPRSPRRRRKHSTSRSRTPPRKSRPKHPDDAMESVEVDASKRDEDLGDKEGGGMDVDEVGDSDDMEAQMQAMLGFGGFGTTKQKKVPGNDAYAVRKEKKTEYRQYMFVFLAPWC
ncbi:MAG: hypothetical protein M1838_002477 [Thelocarpon superellum]|nr:MAG: hypothetical protein M1838_002477 [Thelocarpon superellum]